VWSCGLYIWIDLCEMVHSKDLKWSLNDLPWIYFLWFYLYADGLHFVSLVTNFEEYVDIDLSCVQYWEVRKWIIICLMTENICNRFLFNSSWFGFISSIIYLNNYYLNCCCETFFHFFYLKKCTWTILFTQDRKFMWTHTYTLSNPCTPLNNLHTHTSIRFTYKF
jgi:hypothetical protein